MAQVAESRPADASSALDRVHHWIGGRRLAGTSGRQGPVYNPATGKVAREVDFASAEEVDAAVQVAREAYPAWRATWTAASTSSALAKSTSRATLPVAGL